MKAVRSLSDRTLLHPSPARPKFAFRQLTDYVRRLSFDDSPAPSPLVLPGARQQVEETPTKQLFKTAIGQLGDTKPIPTSSLSVAAVPFIPKEPNKVETSSPSPPQQPTLSVSAAAYLPPWVEAPVSPEERVYPSVRRYEPSLASHVATSVMRPRAGTVAFGSPRENMNPTRGHGNHFQSLDSLQWFAPVESGPGADEFEYDVDSRVGIARTVLELIFRAPANSRTHLTRTSTSAVDWQAVSGLVFSSDSGLLLPLANLSNRQTRSAFKGEPSAVPRGTKTRQSAMKPTSAAKLARNLKSGPGEASRLVCPLLLLRPAPIIPRLIQLHSTQMPNRSSLVDLNPSRSVHLCRLKS